ncbi:MAG TPA: triose-phosphate isomerase family protein [Chthoniobacterales bacterium]
MAAIKPIFGTNWKMRNVARDFARSYASILDAAAELQLLQMLFVMPPATLIRDMAGAALNPKLVFGAQTFHWAEEGEFTGELSTELLRQEGARIVLIGHAERRLLFGETDEMIRQKTKRALIEGFMVVLCVGDAEKQADDSAVKDFLQRQLSEALTGLDAELFEHLILAYEPIWAIGARSGAAASPDRVARSIQSIRDGLSWFPSAASVPILYGGSVNLQNCADLMDNSGINGLFVGRSAALPEDFLSIIRKSLGVSIR